jgi:hypothetical protein
MPADPDALRAAIDLLHLPSRVRALRAARLPRGVPLLLGIVAGDRDAVRDAARLLDRSEDVVRRAATFFVEQILFDPDADSYRVLGASADATNEELRRNMALLMRWLHPDMDRGNERSRLVSRVTLAWEDLKTPDRRAAYDGKRRSLPAARRSQQPRGRSVKPRARFDGDAWEQPGLLRRALSLLFGRARS